MQMTFGAFEECSAVFAAQAVEEEHPGVIDRRARPPGQYLFRQHRKPSLQSGECSARIPFIRRSLDELSGKFEVGGEESMFNRFSREIMLPVPLGGALVQSGYFSLSQCRPCTRQQEFGKQMMIAIPLSFL